MDIFNEKKDRRKHYVYLGTATATLTVRLILNSSNGLSWECGGNNLLKDMLMRYKTHMCVLLAFYIYVQCSYKGGERELSDWWMILVRVVDVIMLVFLNLYNVWDVCRVVDDVFYVASSSFAFIRHIAPARKSTRIAFRTTFECIAT